MEKLIQKFNKPDTLVVISSYPDRSGEPAKQNAVACYAENLMKTYKKRNVVILAENKSELASGIVSNKKTKYEMYEQENLLIVRCWKPGSPMLFMQVADALRNFSKSKNVLIQFEFNMLGSVVLTSALPLFVACLRLIGKKVTLMQHQVVSDLSVLSGHLNIKRGSLKGKILNAGLRAFYKSLGIFSNSIIVHEELLKEKLSSWVNKEKIYVVSHGLSIEDLGGEPKESVRKNLGLDNRDFVLLTFGYIAWYKGVDWLIKKVVEINKDYPERRIKLVIAGGPSATLQSKKHYRDYLAKVQKEIQDNADCVKATGYVPDEDVYKYFKAADMAILPYRAMMSASGPLSFALKFGVPYMISEVLAPSFRNEDVEVAKINSDFDLNKIVFSLKGDDFKKKIVPIARIGYLPKSKEFVNYLRQLRTWENIVFQYEKVMFGTPNFGIIDYMKDIVGRVVMRFNIIGKQENV